MAGRARAEREPHSTALAYCILQPNFGRLGLRRDVQGASLPSQLLSAERNCAERLRRPLGRRHAQLHAEEKGCIRYPLGYRVNKN
jgi:hypothetical protein